MIKYLIKNLNNINVRTIEDRELLTDMISPILLHHYKHHKYTPALQYKYFFRKKQHSVHVELSVRMSSNEKLIHKHISNHLKSKANIRITHYNTLIHNFHTQYRAILKAGT